MLFVVVPCLAAALPAGEDIVLRCGWPSPNDRAPLDVTFSGNAVVIVPPGENLSVRGEAPEGGCRVTIMKDGQPYREDECLNFAAPANPGAYYIPLLVTAAGKRREAELCVIVPHKASGRRTADGLEISADSQSVGNYRHPSRSGNAKVQDNPDCYQPPVWWFRITESNSPFEIMPGITPADLVAASEDTGEKHTNLVPVNYPMWKAVLTLRQALPERLGIPGSALKLISVFRNPAYNRGIGSNAFGRHIYGDAFDFYIDLDGKGKAADLNKDGKLDRRDAYPVIALIEDLQAEGKIPMGGVGVYNTVGGDHEVTMHVDLRGHRSTWGYLYGAGGKRSEFSWASKRFADLDRRDEQAAAERAAKEGRKYAPPHREPLQ